MNLDERLAAIGGRLLGELIDEFPQWEIERENSGRYRAELAGWGVLYGDSAAELRERLRYWRRSRAGGDDLPPSGG